MQYRQVIYWLTLQVCIFHIPSAYTTVLFLTHLVSQRLSYRLSSFREVVSTCQSNYPNGKIKVASDVHSANWGTHFPSPPLVSCLSQSCRPRSLARGKKSLWLMRLNSGTAKWQPTASACCWNDRCLNKTLFIYNGKNNRSVECRMDEAQRETGKERLRGSGGPP